MIRTPKSFPKLRHDGIFKKFLQPNIKNHTMYKPVHHFAKQFNVLVSKQPEYFPKVTSRRTLVSPLLPHYYVDFIADAVLVFGVIICLHLLLILVRLSQMLSCLYSATDKFSFRNIMHRFIAVLYG